MNIVWIILAVLSFLGGQIYLFLCLGKVDWVLEHGSNGKPPLTYDDSCRYPDEDVIE